MSGVSAMEVFRFEDRAVRTVLRDGEPWFVAADVCSVLDIRNTSDALGRLDEDERGLVSIDTPNGRRVEANAVTESGLYALVLGSRKPEAKAFKRWVTGEVLPAIRRTGSYSVPAQRGDITAAGHLELAERYLSAAQALVAAEQKVAELEPAAAAFTTLTDADGDLLVRDAAKDPGISLGQNGLFEKLRELGWIYRASDGRWRAYQATVAAGRMREIVRDYTHPNDPERVIVTIQLRVTVAGMGVLHAKLAPPTSQAVNGAVLPAGGAR